jgi:deazaflavin-dependent oxidoreductase (nitroreductase family)
MPIKDRPKSAPGVPMLFPPWLERLQVKYMNPTAKRIGRYLPTFAVVDHRGRKSGKPYETVVNAFCKGTTLAIALGHGKADWVKNVLAAGEAEVHFTRQHVHITNPRILPVGGSAEGLHWMARLYARSRVAIFVADID